MESFTIHCEAMQHKSKLPIAAFYLATAYFNSDIRLREAVGSHDVCCRSVEAFNVAEHESVLSNGMELH